jgi:hypothetical protein
MCSTSFVDLSFQGLDDEITSSWVKFVNILYKLKLTKVMGSTTGGDEMAQGVASRPKPMADRPSIVAVAK